MDRELKAPTMGMEFIDWARRRARSLSQVNHTVIPRGYQRIRFLRQWAEGWVARDGGLHACIVMLVSTSIMRATPFAR